ncbi:MAG TPA: hypothetical protein VFB59_05345 [Candidatus Saccharimonadales bacterium]|nr:hypothetical protein [Candidatus Saccharimonadales bacterium]
MTHHVIYVPGLGDYNSHGQETVPAGWNKYGVVGHYNPMVWNDKEPFAPKFQRLLDKIDRLSAEGPVSLVGASAGASVALLALAKRPKKVAGVVCLAGKIHHPETVRPELYAENPAFREALEQLQEALPEIQSKYAARIMSIHALYDGSVPARDSIIPGAHEKTMPTIGHVISIVLMLAFRSGTIIRFLQKQAAKIIAT